MGRIACKVASFDGLVAGKQVLRTASPADFRRQIEGSSSPPGEAYFLGSFTMH